MSISRLIKSFSHALRGVRVVFKSEQNFRMQTLAAVAIIVLAIWFEVNAFEWIVLLLLIGLILTLELINSVFERIVDTFKPRIHPIVHDIKDIMAATVLLMSLIAVVIGVVIFAPHLRLFS
ncbi:diacylglycerol kinase family protein [Candidatus Uhrbacteria bacterium]|nr:diacylglycerol kinase family protein [Candidatus Uhrbacteria bacterium]